MGTSQRFFPASLAVALLILASLACGSSSRTEQLSEVVTQETPASASVPKQATRGATQEAEGDATTSPTELPATATAERQDLVLSRKGFGQDGIEVGYGFMVENPNSGFAIENSQYQIAVYDADGTVVSTDSGYIELLLPGQTLGVGGRSYLDEGVTATEIEVQVSEGNYVSADSVPSFGIENVAVFIDDSYSHATGIVSNPYDRAITDVRVSAVAYNTAGEIVGGGFTYVNFLLANSTSGISTTFVASGEVANVELHPVLSGLSILRSVSSVPADATEVVLSKSGFGQQGIEVGYGMLLENPNSGYSVESSRYRITGYSADGSVVLVEEGYVEVLLPEQVLGVGGRTYVRGEALADRMEAQVLSGTFEPSKSLPYFTASNVVYQGGEYSSSVSGEITSPYTTDITDVRASAIAYNDLGEIIGGGFTFVDFVPANDKAAAEIYVVTSGMPATVEIYASVSGLSDFK